jgi:mRNA-degrading endonuclease toxin of MazEF toxin-antitoxin module
VKAPSEGDLIEIDDPLAIGHEQKGRRPALVVSIPEFQETGFALVCPVTTHGGTATKPRSDLEVAIPAGFAVSGVILSHFVRTIDWKGRNSAVLDHLPRATLLNVRSRLKLYLGL